MNAVVLIIKGLFSKINLNYSLYKPAIHISVFPMNCKWISISIILSLLIFNYAGCKKDNSAESTQMLKFGAAVGPAYLNETDYSSTLKSYFNCVVSENHMKWDLIQPSEGTFTYTDSDQIVNFASAHGMAVRGHVLLWHMQIPAWVTAKSYSALELVLKTHIDSLVGRYKGKIFAWDVANEIITAQEGDTGSGTPGLRHNDKPLLGGDYSIWCDNSSDDTLIKKAFEFAHAADPDAQLFLNDNNNYGSNPAGSGLTDVQMKYWNQLQADLLYTYIQNWKNSGVPIHGVGMQLHLDTEYPPDFTMIENDIIRYGALGLEVHFTEVDIRIKTPVNAVKLTNQAVLYNKLALLAVKYPNIVTAFLTWGVSDKYSWIPGYFTGYDAGLLFDSSYQPKESYNVISSTLGL